MDRKKIIVITATILVVLIIITGIVFTVNVRDATQEALDAMESSEDVVVSENDWIEFIPTVHNTSFGIIIYPGGSVDAHSYAVLAHMLATHGYLVIIQPMPLHFAIFNADAAADIIQYYDYIDQWVIIGHSLGGVAASSFVADNLGEIGKMVLLSAYPSASNDLSKTDIDVLSIYGSEDLGRESVEANIDLLPSDTVYLMIKGGNHAQFGYYGEQSGDGIATITAAQQHEITVNATISFIESNNNSD